MTTAFLERPLDENTTMLVNHVAHARGRLVHCLPHERERLQRALAQAVKHLVDYVNVPDPDREKELKAVNKAAKRARDLAGEAESLAARGL